MVQHIILADILLIARIYPRPCGARKNTTQLAKYPRVLYDEPSVAPPMASVERREVTSQTMCRDELNCGCFTDRIRPRISRRTNFD